MQTKETTGIKLLSDQNYLHSTPFILILIKMRENEERNNLYRWIERP